MHKSKISLIISILMLITSTLYPQWVQAPASPSSLIRDIVEFNGVLYLAHGSTGVYKSTDGTVSWQQISNGLNNNQAKSVYQVLIVGDTLYAATVDGIYKSTNGGTDWVKKSNGITIGPGALYEFTESIFEYDSSLFTGASSGIYRSIDGAENWIITNVSNPRPGPKYFVNHNGTLFAARETNNTPYGYKSIDDGLTWDPLTSISVATITFVSEPGKLWAGTIHGVWLSTDNGNSWEHRSNGLSPDPYSSSIIRVNGMLITSLKFGGSGIFRSMDEGMNWEDLGDGLPFLNSIEKLLVFEDKILAATSDGLWQRDTTEIVTALKEKNSLLSDFRLYQNYPNPFNPSTHLRFQISDFGSVTLRIYDVLGRELKTLVNEELLPGNYEVEWNGTNDSGTTVANGVYIYRLRSGNHDKTLKMILMR